MEYFDVCDENGLPTGEIVPRAQAHLNGIPHRTAHIWVMRDTARGAQVLMQKRSRNKDSYPGFFDTSAAGHIQAGDEPLESAQRELFEELGIAAKPEELTYVGNIRIRFEAVFHNKPFRENEYSWVYLYREPVDAASLHLQESEVEEVRWFDLDGLAERARREKDVFCVEPASLVLLEGFLNKEKA